MSEHDLNLHYLGHSIRPKPAGHDASREVCLQ
jgi:hypothetical protein